jgi:hypothetical protein
LCCKRFEKQSISLHHAASVNRSRLAYRHWHAQCLQAVEGLGLMLVHGHVGFVAVI